MPTMYNICREKDVSCSPCHQQLTTNLSANSVMLILDIIALRGLQTCFTRQLTYQIKGEERRFACKNPNVINHHMDIQGFHKAKKGM